mgnify:FL=1
MVEVMAHPLKRKVVKPVIGPKWFDQGIWDKFSDLEASFVAKYPWLEGNYTRNIEEDHPMFTNWHDLM